MRFVVQSPFQTLGAIEASVVLDIPEAGRDLVVIRGPEALGNQQLDRIAAQVPWRSIREIPFATGPIGTASRLTAVRALRSGDGPIAMGEYRSPLMRDLAHATEERGESVLLLDDGVGTLLARDLRVGDAIDAPNYERSWRRRAIRALAPVHDVPPKALTFVTSYAIEVGPQDSLIRHHFDWTRRRIGEARDRSAVYVGTSLVESGALAEDWYVGHAIEVCADGRPYVPHRRESASKLDRLRGGGVEVTPLPGPFEFELADAHWRPDRVDSVFSSVLHNLPHLMATEVVAHRPPDRAITPEWKPRIDDLFATLASHAPTVRVVAAE